MPGAAGADDDDVVLVVLTMVCSIASLHRADVERGARVDARVEGEDHQRAEHDHDAAPRVEQRLEPEPGVRLAGVVVDDRAQAVACRAASASHSIAQVPDLPERVGPLAGDEARSRSRGRRRRASGSRTGGRSTSTTSSSPEPRMNSQLYSSKLPAASRPRPERRAAASMLGAASSWVSLRTRGEVPEHEAARTARRNSPTTPTSSAAGSAGPSPRSPPG